MRFVSLTTVDIKTPNQERIVRDKEQGLELSGEVGRNGRLINLGSGTLTVKISDAVEKISKSVVVPPFWNVVFKDDHISELNITTDTDGTWYYLTIAGNHAS